MNGFVTCGLWGIWMLASAMSSPPAENSQGLAAFERGNQLFDQGKFLEAQQAYTESLKARGPSANIYYDLGNAEYRQGHRGAALLDFERALVLDPRHPEAAANRKWARAQTGANVPAERGWEAVFSGQPVGSWALAGAVAFWVMLFALAFRWTARREVSSVSAGIAGLGALVFLYALGVCWRDREEENAAVVLAEKSVARLAPAANAALAEDLPAGSRVILLQERGPWIYAVLPGSGRGWVPRDDLARIRPKDS